MSRRPSFYHSIFYQPSSVSSSIYWRSRLLHFPWDSSQGYFQSLSLISHHFHLVKSVHIQVLFPFRYCFRSFDCWNIDKNNYEMKWICNNYSEIWLKCCIDFVFTKASKRITSQISSFANPFEKKNHLLKQSFFEKHSRSQGFKFFFRFFWHSLQSGKQHRHCAVRQDLGLKKENLGLLSQDFRFFVSFCRAFPELDRLKVLMMDGIVSGRSIAIFSNSWLPRFASSSFSFLEFSGSSSFFFETSSSAFLSSDFSSTNSTSALCSASGASTAIDTDKTTSPSFTDDSSVSLKKIRNAD